MPISKIKSSGIEADSVTGSSILDGTVDTADLANGAVTSAKLDTNIDIAGTLDVTGTLTADSSATITGDLTVDTNTLHVDSTNNRVGVGTLSPISNIHINGNTPVVTIRDTRSKTWVSGETLSTINFDSLDASNTPDTIARVNVETDDGSVGTYTALTFSTATPSALTERMRISSSGYVTKPNTPSFCIFGDTNPNFITDGSDTTIYTGHLGSGASAFDHNIGSHWSYTTGRFTAPVAGRYFFSFTATTNDANSHFVDIHKNGARVGGHTLQYGYTYQTATKTIILDLAANDYVDARRRGNGYGFYSCNFAGYLLG